MDKEKQLNLMLILVIGTFFVCTMFAIGSTEANILHSINKNHLEILTAINDSKQVEIDFLKGLKKAKENRNGR